MSSVQKKRGVANIPAMEQKELIIQCLAFLTAAEACSCARVSKTWNDATQPLPMPPHLIYCNEKPKNLLREIVYTKSFYRNYSHDGRVYNIVSMHKSRVMDVFSKVVAIEQSGNKKGRIVQKRFTGVKWLFMHNQPDKKHKKFFMKMMNQVEMLSGDWYFYNRKMFFGDKAVFPNIRALVMARSRCSDPGFFGRHFPNCQLFSIEADEMISDFALPYFNGSLRVVVFNQIKTFPFSDAGIAKYLDGVKVVVLMNGLVNIKPDVAQGIAEAWRTGLAKIPTLEKVVLNVKPREQNVDLFSLFAKDIIPMLHTFVPPGIKIEKIDDRRIYLQGTIELLDSML